jgi:methylenetetrahydrofolate reductase (NADPH)
MRIDSMLAERRPVFSFEFFPPRTDEGVRSLFETVSQLRDLEPSFVSVTYGAGGSTRTRTLELVLRIRAELDIEPMAHFTCVGASRDELRGVLDAINDAGLDNVLALRGDPPNGTLQFTPVPGGLAHGSELVELITRSYRFCVGAACYLEKHVESGSLDDDLRYARLKVENGAAFLITQLFFDNRLYFEFIDRARAAGIRVPIIPGIMPITNVAQIQRFTTKIGASIPAELLDALVARQDDPDAVLQLGVAWATLQCAELLAAGAPGVHFYTLNRSPATRAILSALRVARPWDRGGEVKERKVRETEAAAG